MQISLLIQTRTLFHWRKRYYGLWTHILVKNILMLDLFQLLSSPDVNWWTGVVWITCGLLWCFYQLFGLSFWRHPFTAEHPLLRHWCRDTFLQIWWRNKLIYISEGLRTSQSNTHLPLWSIFFIALSFWMFWGSWSHRCIRMKFSFPFRLSLVQGLGCDSSSDTELCVKPKTSSPNTRWPARTTTTRNSTIT